MNAQLELEREEWQRIGGLCVIQVHWVSGYISVVSGGPRCPYVRLQDSRCIQQNSAMDAAGIRRPVTQIPARVTLVWRELIVGAPRAGTEWQPCQRLWRPSFHLAVPPPPPSASPEIHLGPRSCTCPKERHPSLPLIEVFSQSITCGDAIKAS